MEPLQGLDAGFLALETGTSHLQVGAVLVLDPPEGRRSLFSPSTRYAQVRRVFEQRIHLVRPLRQRAVAVPLGLHHPIWMDDPEFELDDHVHRASLPDPGGRRELDDLVADFMARPLDPARPLWEMVVVEGLAGNQTAVVVKLHHAILDGVSGASLLATFLDLGPRGRPIPFPAAPWDPEPIPSSAALLRYAAGELVHQPEVAKEAFRQVVDAVVDVAGHNRQLAEQGQVPPPAPFSAPRTSLNGNLSSRRRFASVAVPLEDVKLVRRTFGVTVNDVLLAGVAGAVRRLLADRGESPDRALVALVPVSTRGGSGQPAVAAATTRVVGTAAAAEVATAGGAGAGAETGAAAGAGAAAAATATATAGPGDGQEAGSAAEVALGNSISAMLVGLATDIDDPVERLAAIAAGTRVAKAQEGLMGGRLFENLAQMAPPLLSSRAIRWAAGLRLFDRLPPLYNLVVSTVPGPDFAIWCAGSRVAALTPIGPIAEGAALNVTAMSYQGTINFGLLGCRRLAAEVDRLAVLLDDSLAELVVAALEQRGAAG